MIDYNTYYWCPECKLGWTHEQTTQVMESEGYNHGHGNAAPPEYKQICPDCESDCVEGYKCDGCQEIFEATHQYRNVRVCADCLPVHMLSDAISNTKFNIACQLVTLLGMTYEVASARVTEVFNDYDFNEGE